MVAPNYAAARSALGQHDGAWPQTERPGNVRVGEAGANYGRGLSSAIEVRSDARLPSA